MFAVPLSLESVTVVRLHTPDKIKVRRQLALWPGCCQDCWARYRQGRARSWCGHGDFETCEECGRLYQLV